MEDHLVDYPQCAKRKTVKTKCRDSKSEVTATDS